MQINTKFALFIQMILTWLISITDLLWMPALYLAVFALFALVAFINIPNNRLINYID